MEVVEWKPTPQQEVALSSTANEVLFGGARGGGKTDAALTWFLEISNNKKARGLVIRRNAVDLADFVDRARQLYWHFGGKIKGNPSEIHFPSGAIIYTGHLGQPDAYTRFQGWEIHRLLIEEVTHIPTELLYEKLLGSVRSTVDGLKTQVFLTTNPGGAGHEWVKERFKIDIFPPNKKFQTVKEVNGIEIKRTFLYVPATVDDNPHLKDKDPDYVAFLEGLPENLREQWRYGKWDDFDIDGAYYNKQMNAAIEDRRITRIPIEPQLKTFTFWDLGISDAMTIWVLQVYGKELRMIAYYENSGESLQHYINWLQDFRDKYNFTYEAHYAPHDIQVRELSSGRSRLEIARQMGIKFRVVKSTSVADGIEAGRNILSRVWFDDERCKQGIKCLRNYRKEFDQKKNVFKDNPLHDWASHGADAFRMFAVTWKDILVEDRTRPINAQIGAIW